MKILRNYRVVGALYQGGTGPEAQVGDQIRLFLDQAANPAFPEFINGTIQHPITKVACNSETSYDVQYDEDDLDGAAALIRPCDVVDAVVVSALDILTEALVTETAARIAGDTSSVILATIGVPSYANLTAANVVLNAGDIYFDVTLGKFRSATA